MMFLCCHLLTSGCTATKSHCIKSSLKNVPYKEKISYDSKKVKKDIEKYLQACTAPSGLLRSFTSTSPYFFSTDSGKFHKVVYGKMGYLEEQAYTYDLALGTIGLLLVGKKEQAEKILDLFESEFYKDKNGINGIFNSYIVTNEVYIDELKLGADGDRIHAGPTLWVVLAALNHMKIVRNTRYLEFILDIVDWCRTELTYYKFPDGERGAVSMGFGWGPDWSKIFSTEHNVDYFAVLRMLRDIYDDSSEEVRKIFREKNITKEWLEDEMEHVGRWISEVVFDKEFYCFIAGVNENGVDRLKVLDGTSWGLGGVGPENFEKWGIDLDKLIESTEKNFRATYKMEDGRELTGFDFTDFEGTGYSRKELFWFEGTGQMIIAFGELSHYFSKKGDLERASYYKDKAIKYSNDMNAFTEYYGLKGALPYMAILMKEKEIIKTLKYEWEIPRGRTDCWVGSLSSTMWFLYCTQDFYNTMKWKFN